MTAALLPPPLSAAPTVPQLAALRDALATLAVGSSAPAAPWAPAGAPGTDPTVLASLLDGLRSLGGARATSPAPAAALPVTTFSAGHRVDGPLFDTPLEMLMAFVRWLLGLESR